MISVHTNKTTPFATLSTLFSVLFKAACALLAKLNDVFVYQEKQMMVYVERRVADDASLSKDEAFGSIRNQLCTFREGETHVTQ